MLIFGVPGCIFLLIPIIWGSPVAFPLFIPAFAFLIAIPLAELGSHFFPDFFYAHHWRDRPKPTFSIIRGLKNQGQFKEALSQLTSMAATDSQEENIWLEMLEIALIDLRDKKLGEEIYQEAISALESQTKRDNVKRFFENIP